MKFSIIIIVFFLVSCSNSSETGLDILNEGTTLRNTVEQLDNSVSWTLESSDEISLNTSQKKELLMQNDNALFFYGLQSSEIVYPYIDGFGSLNTEGISQNLFSFIYDFLESLPTLTLDVSFFQEEKKYVKTLIEYNFRNYTHFSDYVIGEAFVFDAPISGYEIPIRFYFEDGYLDCFLYCVFTENGYVIEQFDIGKIIHD